ncbi:MAG: hypothetical protein EBT03_12360 [Betaproteobacteria bacterium]|nr:hypothetical protein [Betaproteobacteria bacterium]
MTRVPDGRITKVRSMLPRHKAANWLGPGRGRKSTRPGANGLVELTPFEFLDRLADLVPPPRKHRHRYHGVFAPNHRLRKAVTALAIGNVGKQREGATGGDGNDGRATGGCSDAHQKPRSHDTSRIAWAKLLTAGGGGVSARVPSVWRRRPSQRRRPAGAGSLRTGGSQAGEGQDGFARVKLDPHASWRAAGAAARLTGPGPAHRLGRARPGA